jgi:hypothetical protein
MLPARPQSFDTERTLPKILSFMFEHKVNNNVLINAMEQSPY